MSQLSYYSPAERQSEKDRAREQDERDLRQGHVSREELRLRNGFLAPLEVVGSSVRRKGIIA